MYRQHAENTARTAGTVPLNGKIRFIEPPPGEHVIEHHFLRWYQPSLNLGLAAP